MVALAELERNGKRRRKYFSVCESSFPLKVMVESHANSKKVGWRILGIWNFC